MSSSAQVDKETPKPPTDRVTEEKPEDLAPNPTVDDFFSRMNYDMRRPKPAQEAVSAALQAIQRLGLQSDSEESISSEEVMMPGMCVACGSQNPESNKFCATCGVALVRAATQPPTVVKPSAQPVPSEGAPGPHYYHHHYHHHYFASENSLQQPALTSPPTEARESGGQPREATRARAPLTGSTPSRGEAAVRKVIQDWALACNTTHLDDLIELYASDALVLRPNVPPIRGTASIREFLFSVLNAGLGEVELDPLRVELFGDVAFEAGRCKMLVPAATGKRREERGKYVVVLTKQGGEWRIIADSWSSDLNIGMEVASAKPGNKI